MAFYWLSKLPFARPQNAPKPSKTLQTLQNQNPNPPHTFPNRHPRAKATAMAFYWLSKLPFARPQTLQNSPKPSKPSKTLQKHLPQQAGTPGPRPSPPNPPKPSKPSNTFPNRHPRAKATAMAFYWLSKLPFARPQTLQNSPKPSKPSKTLQTPHTPSATGRHPRAKATALQTSKTLQTLQHLPQQAPQGQGHSNGFLLAFKAAVCQAANAPKPSKTLQNSPKPSKPSVCQAANAPKPFKTLQTLPNPPNLQTPSPTGTPGPRPQQWLSIGFQSCRLPGRPPKLSKTLQTLQNPPNPPHTFRNRQAPQGQGHSNGFLLAFKAAKATSESGTPWPRPQPSKPSKTLQTLHTPSPTGTPGPRPQQWLSIQAANAPKPSKTIQTLQTPSPTGTPGPRPQQWLLLAFKAAVCQAANPPKLSKTLQTLQNPPNPPHTFRNRQAPQGQGHSPPNPPKPSKPSTHLPQQAPQGQGHSNGFLLAFKSCRLPGRKRSKTLQTLQTVQTLQTPSPTGTPGPRPQQWLSICFQSCRVPGRKPSKTLQNPPNPPKPSKPPTHLPQQAGTPGQGHSPPNPPKPSKPSTHLPQQAPQGQGHSNGFLLAFKAAVCQAANAPKPSKTPKTLQTLQTLHTPSPTGTPGPRPQQWLSIGFQSCRLPGRKPSKTLQNPPNPPKPSKPPTHLPQQAGTLGPRPQPSKPSKTLQTLQTLHIRHPRAKATAMAFYWLSKLPFARPQTLQNSPKPSKPSKPSKHLPQQAPSRAKATAMAFYWLSQAANPPKLSKTLHPPKPSKPPTHLPQQAGTPGPRPQPSKPSKTLQTLHTPSPTGTPGPRPQQWLSIGFQSCRLPGRKRSKTLQNPPNPPNPPNTFPNRHPGPRPQPSKPSKTFQTLHTPSPTGTPGPRPQQWLSIGFQSCRLPGRKPSKTLKNPPNPPNTFPNRHPRAKATAMAFYWLSKLPFARPQTLQNSPKPSKPSKTLQTPHTPSATGRHPRAKATALQTLQNPPNPPHTFPNRHPRAKATAMAFYWLSKLPFARPQTLQNRPKPSKTLQTLQTPPKPSKPSKPSKHLPQQAPQGQGHSNGFLLAFKAAVCQAANPPKLSKTFQTLQNPPNPPHTFRNRQAPQGQGHSPPNSPKPSKPSTHLPQQAPQGQGHSNGFLLAFKAAVCQAANAPKPSKTLQTLQTPSPNPPNTFSKTVPIRCSEMEVAGHRKFINGIDWEFLIFTVDPSKCGLFMSVGLYGYTICGLYIM